MLHEQYQAPCNNRQIPRALERYARSVLVLECMAFTSETIRLPRMNQFAEELAEFCGSLEVCLRPGQEATARSRGMHKLRELACRYRDRPSMSELKYMVLCNLVLDFAAHGWTVETQSDEIHLRSKPASDNDSPEAAKDQIRAKHLI